MIARLTGTLDHLARTAPASAEIALPGGLVYESLVPTYHADELSGRVGQTVTLFTRQLLEGQAQGTTMTPRLLGFPSREDRAFFELFTTVRGLGPRKALRSLAEPPAQLARHIAGRDAKALQRLPEIGKKLAETIIADLAGKVDGYLAEPLDTAALNAAAVVLPGAVVTRLPPAGAEAVLALTALGEPRDQAEQRVAAALRAAPELDSADAIVSAVFAAGA